MRNFYNLKYDSVFKNVFFRNEILLKKLLESILVLLRINCDIKNIKIKNCELTKNRLYIKNKTVDILVETDTSIINFEVNRKWSEKILKRNLLYSNAIMGSLIKRKNSYSSLKEFIQININYDYRSNNSMYLYELFDYKHIKKYTDKYKIIEINIDKIIGEWYNCINKKDYYKKYKYLLVLGFDLIEFNNIKKGDDRYMDKIKEEVFLLNEDEEFYQVITDEEDEEKLRMTYYEDGEETGIKKGIKKGKREGKIEGKREEKLLSAKKMKNENLEINLIKKITGLDINTIKSL